MNIEGKTVLELSLVLRELDRKLALARESDPHGEPARAIALEWSVVALRINSLIQDTHEHVLECF
jgi:hypothetical protein